MVQKIDAALKDSIDVVWNLTFAGNIISANVRYAQIEEIAKVQGVKKVFVENRYEPMVIDKNETNDPNMATSSAQIDVYKRQPMPVSRSPTAAAPPS